MPTFRVPSIHIPTDVPPLGMVPTSAISDSSSKEPASLRQAAHITHDKFVSGAHSGSVECRITVETPLICGNKQEERPPWTKLLHPFVLDPKKDEPALPASGLRGMFSTIAESGSGSALRVLENRGMSYRRSVSDGLSAIGMIVEKDGDLNVFPLADPHFDRVMQIALPSGDRATYYPNIFEFARPKIYFGTFTSISSPGFLKTYLSNSSPLGGPFYGVHRDWVVDKVKNRRFWLGEELRPPDRRNPPGDVSTWESLSEEQKGSGDWIRGVLRVLGKHHERISDLPTKKHEFFMRFSVEDEEALRAGTAKVFPIEREALTRFNELADDRANAENQKRSGNELLPFSPNGTPRGNVGKDRPGSSWELKPGDIVFFRPSENGTSIAEVSLSSAWRGRVEEESPKLSKAASVHSFFQRDRVPLSPDRDHLTIVEQLLGVVEIRDKKAEKDPLEKPAFALASRLRFHNALLETAPNEGAWQYQGELLSPEQRATRDQLNLTDIPLKNLASPKLPSPTIYFKPRPQTGGQSGYISKSKLNPRDHAPQGIKCYLRRDPETYNKNVAAEAFTHQGRLANTADRRSIARQHQSVARFVRPGSTFTMRIDFTNLSDLELQLLVYCLRPSETFRHLLGHGKPLGLGQVKIDISALRLIDRKRRYASDSLLDDRWHEEYLEGKDILPEKLASLNTAFREWADANLLGPVLKSIELAGAPIRDGIPIHYPQTEDVADGIAAFESEHYGWFVQNDATGNRRPTGQYVRPLIDSAGQVAETVSTLYRAQRDGPPPLVYSGPVVPIAAPDGRGGPRRHPPERQGVPQGGAGPNPARQIEEPVDRPDQLRGKSVTAVARDPQKDGRVPFDIVQAGKPVDGITGYFEVGKYARSAFARQHPLGEEVTATVINVQGATCDLKLV